MPDPITTIALGGPGLLNQPDVQQVAYSSAELTKIRVAGGLLVIAVLLITYWGYKWAMNRRNNWTARKDLEEAIAEGQLPVGTPFIPEPLKINKIIYFAVGGIALLAGVVMYFF